MSKILTLSDSPCMITGLSKVHRKVIDGLIAAGHTVEAGCWWFVDERGPQVGLEPHKYHIPIHPVIKKPEKALEQLHAIIEKYKPDIILTIGDYWDLWHIAVLKIKHNMSFKWISYLTVDSEPIDEEYIEVFNHMDVILCPSKWSCDVVKKYTGHDTTYVPFGVDEEFYPLSKSHISDLKKERGIENKFRAIMVAMNSDRKNIPAFIEAFADFASDKEDVCAYIHTDIGNPHGYFDIGKLVSRYKLNKKMEFSGFYVNSQKGIDIKELNEEYNCSDVLVVSSLNEGFGMPVIEGMACGVMPILNNCTSLTELVGPGLLVNNTKYIGLKEAFQNLIDIKDLSKKLTKSYNMWNKGKLPKLKCRKFASEFKWDFMKKQINEVILNMNSEVVITVEKLI